MNANERNSARSRRHSRPKIASYVTYQLKYETHTYHYSIKDFGYWKIATNTYSQLMHFTHRLNDSNNARFLIQQ